MKYQIFTHSNRLDFLTMQIINKYNVIGTIAVLAVHNLVSLWRHQMQSVVALKFDTNKYNCN